MGLIGQVTLTDYPPLKYTYDEIGNLTGKAYYGYYHITASAGNNGTISPTSASVYYGGNQTFTITPATGYHVKDITVDGKSIGVVETPSQSNTMTYTFSNMSADHSISASFAINTYKITTSAGSNGSISPSSPTLTYGSNQTFTITPVTGYHIASIFVDGASIGVVENPILTAPMTYAFTNINAAHTISATFAINMYPITMDAHGYGDIIPTSGSVPSGNYPTSISVPHGSNQSFNITHSVRYRILDVLVDDVSVVGNPGYSLNASNGLATYTFTNVTKPRTISAGFSKIPCSYKPARLLKSDPSGSDAVYYITLQDAYNAAADGGTIQSMAEDFHEDFVANRNVNITINGGYSCVYADPETDPAIAVYQNTLLIGAPSVTSGVVNMKDFRVMQ